MSFINIQNKESKGQKDSKSSPILSFQVNNENNDFLISFMNGLRRTILSDIPIWTIDEEKIEFSENNSVLNNEFLKHRLILIPFLNEDPSISYDHIRVECSVKNESENIKSIYVSDFKLFNEDTETELDIKKYLSTDYEDILFAKLKYNEYFSFQAKFTQNTSHHGGAQYCPVSTCSVTFEHDESELINQLKQMDKNEQNIFKINNQQKLYKKNKFGNPHTFLMNIESIGYLTNHQIIKKALSIIKQKIESYQEKIKDYTLENGFYLLSLDHENDTLGNLISSYINDEKDISFSGYNIEHPLYEVVKLKIKTELSKEKLIELLTKKNKFLIDLIDKFMKEFK